jgi:hypothetical protein
MTSLTLALLAGCASAPQHSDFLGDMSGFKQARNGRDAVYWVKPGLTRDQVLSYKTVIIEPVTIALSPTSEHKGIRADEAVALAQYYRTALVNALQGDYAITATSGPHVLRIRPAITDIHRYKPISPLEFTPVGLALTGVEAVTGMPSPKEMLLGPSPFNEASVEMEFTDSTTGERLVAFKDTRKAKRVENKPVDVTWGKIKELLDEWASDVKRGMEDPRQPV